MRLSPLILFLFVILSLSGCKIYNQNILFETKENIINSQDTIASKLQKAEKNYVIQPNDYIEVRIFTANGEALLNPVTPQDPNAPNQANNNNNNNTGGQNGMGMQQGGQGGQQLGAVFGGGNPNPLEMPIFAVRQDGMVTLPMVGDVKVLGMTLHQTDSLLKIKYSEQNLYQNCFVRTRFHNKRVTVFKGQMGFIYPLRNEKVHLLEVLASFGGMDNGLRGSNVRLIRGDLKNPNVYVINLRTMESLKTSIDNMKPYHNLILEPNDIIYVEPVRKTFWEAIDDLARPVASVSSIILAIVVLLRL